MDNSENTTPASSPIGVTLYRWLIPILLLSSTFSRIEISLGLSQSEWRVFFMFALGIASLWLIYDALHDITTRNKISISIAVFVLYLIYCTLINILNHEENLGYFVAYSHCTILWVL